MAMVCLARSFIFALGATAREPVHVKLGWETGFVDSGLPVPLKPSFSINGDGWVPGKDPYKDYCQPNPSSNSNCWPESINETTVNGGRSIHSLTVEKVSWAREGQHVLKIYADGRNYGTSRDYAFRAELSAVQDQYVFLPGDYQLFSMSFWPDATWDAVTKYSGLLLQWKMSPGFPHGALRLSNMGDYKLYFRGYDLWPTDGGDGRQIGYAKREAWNDIKFFYKKSINSDGEVRVWLNGKLVFEHYGKNLLKITERGYTKFGQYTEIRDERTVYYDAVEFCHGPSWAECLAKMGFSSLEDWLQQGQDQPTVRIEAPLDGTAIAASEALTLQATATDREGVKFGTPGALHSVEFFAGNCSLGTDVGNKGSFSLSSSFSESGTYALTAVALDVDGNRAVSEPVLVHIGNLAPLAAFVSPAPGENIESGSVHLVANATDADGSISKVEFFLGSTSLGVAAAAGLPSYAATWASPTSGPIVLTVKVTDDGGASTTAEVGVTVGAALTTSRLPALHDATIRESSPSANSNWGDNEVYGKPGGQNVALHKFDVSGQTADHEVRSATLRLYATGERNLPGRLAVYGAGTETNWQETTVTWQTAPARGSKISTQTLDGKNKWFSWDVTHYVAEQWASATTITFWLEDDELDWNKATFESRREGNSNPPELVVVTSSMAAPVPTVSSAAGCSVSVKELPNLELGTSATSTTTTSTTTTTTTSATADASSHCDVSNSSRLLPIADASLQEASPSSSGNWGNIEVYGKPGQKMIVALLKFDISSLTSVQKAVLKVYCVVARNVPGVVTVFSAENEWDEASVNWNTRPARGSAKIASFTVLGLSEDHYTGTEDVGYYSVDVTDFVVEREAAGASTLTFWLEDVALEYLALKFESRRDDKNFPPVLEVATGESCNAAYSGRLRASVPNVEAFEVDAAAKKAICDSIEAESGAPSGSSTCVFSLEAGDLLIDYELHLPSSTLSVQGRVFAKLEAMTTAQLEVAVAAKMAEVKADAASFQVFVVESSRPALGSLADTSTEATTATIEAEFDGIASAAFVLTAWPLLGVGLAVA